MKQTPAPGMVFQEADLSVRVVRDIFSEQFERAVVDNEEQHHRLDSSSPARPRVARPGGAVRGGEVPLFERYGVEKAIQSTLSRRVDLPSGGYLMIDYAEAMTVIDINSGSFTGPARAPSSRTRSPAPTWRPRRRWCAS